MTKENALEALENMRADVVDFGDLIEGSTYSSVDDYELLKQVLAHYKLLKERDVAIFPVEAMITWQCLVCGEEIRISWHFCPFCGQRLRGSDSK